MNINRYKTPSYCCHTQVNPVCHGISKIHIFQTNLKLVSKINKLDIIKILNPLLEQLKIGKICQAKFIQQILTLLQGQQLHSSAIFNNFQEKMCCELKSLPLNLAT